MAVKAFSSDWAKLFKDEINKSGGYKSAAKGWKWTVGLVVEAEPTCSTARLVTSRSDRPRTHRSATS
jgi:hypothetical protein